MKNFIIIAILLFVLFFLVKNAMAYVELGCYVNETFENSGELQVIREGNLVTTTLKP